MLQLLSIYALLLLILVCILAIHEAGHILALRRLGVPLQQVRLGFGPVLHTWHVGSLPVVLCLLPMGACCGIQTRRAADGAVRRTIGQDAIIIASGLLAGLAPAPIAGLLALLLKGQPIAVPLVATAFLSLFVTALNLLPIPGTDGGHLVMLFLAGRGLELSPDRELRVARLGMRALSALSLLAVAAIVLEQIL